MGAQGAQSNKVFPQRSFQTKLGKLLCPVFEKLAKDASSRRNVELIEDCHDAIRWFSRPLLVKTEGSGSPGSSLDSDSSFPSLTPRSSEFNLQSEACSLGVAVDCFSISPAKNTIETEPPPRISPSRSDANLLHRKVLHMCVSDEKFALYDGMKGIDLEDAQFLMKPLFYACQSSSPLLAETAIKAILRLIVESNLLGTAGLTSGPSATLLKQVLDALCFSSILADDNPTLESSLLETLLYISASTQLVLRGDSLLQVFRVLFRMACRSPLPLHSQYGKAAIAQMVALSLHRLETAEMHPPVPPVAVESLVSILPRSAQEIKSAQNFLCRTLSGNLPGTTVVPSQNPTLPKSAPSSRNLIEAENCDLNYMKRQIEEWDRMAENPTLHPFKLSASKSAGAELDLAGSESASIANDTFMLLQDLCRVSMGSPVRIGGKIDTGGLREKTMALEMLCFVLEQAGPTFMASTRFLELLRQTLCFCLVENVSAGAAPLPTVFQLCCSLCLRILARFREIWRQEVPVFLRTLLLRALTGAGTSQSEIGSSGPFLRCMVALSLLKSLSLGGQILVDLYANYDCNPAQEEDLVHCLLQSLLDTASGQCAGLSPPLSQSEEIAVKVEGLKTLSVVLASLHSWVQARMDQNQVKDSELESEAAESEADSLDFPGSVSAEAVDPASAPEEGLTETERLGRRRALKKEVQEAVSLFNSAPEKGLKALQDLGMVEKSRVEVAALLLHPGGLRISKKMVGEYLSGNSDASREVLKAYVDLFKFEGLDFDCALRTFLGHCHLPGESQKIERVLERFAEKYDEANPGVFSNAVTAHVLAYSLIMLNTDAHNPAVKKKMTKEQFIRNNRGIDNGADLPAEFLSAQYDRIVGCEIRVPGTDNSRDRSSSQAPGRTAPRTLSMVRAFTSRKRVSDSSSPLPGLSEILKRMKDTFGVRGLSYLPSESVYFSPSTPEIVGPLLSPFLPGVLQVLSMEWEGSLTGSDSAVIMDSFKCAVELTSRLGLTAQRDQFCAAINRYTLKTSKASRSGWSAARSSKAFLRASSTFSALPLDYQALTLKPQGSLLACCW